MTPWYLILLLATGDTVQLKSSPECCAAYVRDVMGGYSPVAYVGGEAVPVVTSVCVPGDTLIASRKPAPREARVPRMSGSATIRPRDPR
jgi:hypothetical protein